MKISIAMATYNGAKYLQEQLDSFVNQTRLPDELIVCDDMSTDNTLDILMSFSHSAPFKINIVRNECNLGYAKNFEKAISLCAGDIIFLSDQDDFWLSEKIAKVENEFGLDQDVLLIINDARIMLSDGSYTNLTKLQQTLSLGLGDQAFTTGCCMAFKKELVKVFFPIPADDFVHDTWLNKLTLILSSKKVLPLILQNYRRHESNTSTWIASRTYRVGIMDLIKEYKDKNSRVPLLARKKQLIELDRRISLHCAYLHDILIHGARLEMAIVSIKAEMRAVQMRICILELPRWQRWPQALKMYKQGGYQHFSGRMSLVKDLMQP